MERTVKKKANGKFACVMFPYVVICYAMVMAMG